MLFVLEMIMLMVGIRVIIRGTLPSIPFVRPRYKLDKRAMKLLGAVLVLPIPITVVVSLILKLVLREVALGYDVALDWIVFTVAAAATFIIVRRMWQP